MNRSALRTLTAASTITVVLLLAACAHPALRQSERLRQAGQHEQALQTLQRAYDQQPLNGDVRRALVKQRDMTVAHLLGQMQTQQQAGMQVTSPEWEQWVKRLEALAPQDPRVISLRNDMNRSARHQALLTEARGAIQAGEWARAEATLRSVLSADASNRDARNLLADIEDKRNDQTRQQASLQLATSGKPVTLEFREAALRTVFEALAKAANVNFVFDKDVRGESKVTLYLRNTTVDEALRVITNTQQLGVRLLNPNTVLVFPNTAQKQRELLDTVTRSFYLVNADPKQVQNLVRTVAKSRDMFVDERLNLLVVRDTPDVMRLVERLVVSVDLPDPEVMLELEVMEVSSKRLLELGVTLPTSASYGVISPTDASKLSTDLLTSSSSGLRWSTSNPAAIATLRGTVDASNLLANPKIRARNREKAKITLGEKLPVFSSTTTTGTATSTSVNISYVDVGLKLDLEPQVQLNDEVIIKVNLDVTNITNRVLTKNGDLAYQVGSRQATTSLRLKDGETQVLAGLINDDENKSSAGLPWLHELPGLGRLFGQTSDTHNKTEVILLITPRIIRSLSQERLQIDALSSGTDAQPGAAPFVITQGQVRNDVGQSGGMSRTLGNGTAGLAPADSALSGPRITGPEVAMRGATIQATLSNPDQQLLTTVLIYDAAVFEEAPGRSSGRLSVTVPPGGRANQVLRVKRDAPLVRTELRVDQGTASWPVQVIPGVSRPVAAPQSPAAAMVDDVPTNDDEAP